MPTLLVILQTRNRFDLSLKIISTILNQTFRDFHLLISDNSSSRILKHEVSLIDDKRILYNYVGDLNLSPIQHGQYLARYLSDKYKYYTIVHDDDLLSVDHLESNISFLKGNDLEYCYSPPLYINNNDEIINIRDHFIRPSKDLISKKISVFNISLLSRNITCCPTIFFSNSAKWAMSYFSIENNHFSDYSLSVLLILNYGLNINANCSYCYRIGDYERDSHGKKNAAWTHMRSRMQGILASKKPIPTKIIIISFLFIKHDFARLFFRLL